MSELCDWLDRTRPRRGRHGWTPDVLAPFWAWTLDAPMAAEGIHHLAAMPRLLELTITGNYTDDDLAGLRELSGITHLNFKACPRLTPRVFAHLSGWRALCDLRISGLSLLGPGVEALAKLPLRRIDLGACFDEEGASGLACLQSLEVLRTMSAEGPSSLAQVASQLPLLGNFEVGLKVAFDDCAAESLATSPSLRHLNVWSGASLSDQGLLSLASLSALESLDIGLLTSQVTDRGLAALGKLHELQRLSVGGADQCTGAFTRSWKGLSQLRELELADCNLAGRALESIVTLPKLESLSLAGNPITDADVPVLLKGGTLSMLDLSGTSVGVEGLVALGKDLLGSVRYYFGEELITEAWTRLADALTRKDFYLLQIVWFEGHNDGEAWYLESDMDRLRGELGRQFGRAFEDSDLNLLEHCTLFEFRNSAQFRSIDLAPLITLEGLADGDVLQHGRHIPDESQEEVKRQAAKRALVWRIDLDALELTTLTNPAQEEDSLSLPSTLEDDEFEDEPSRIIATLGWTSR